ncbi:MAG TPA: hypothetical protein VMK05_06560 [Burkholderiales bacterium]|nr:hypothetical protein [Burkholderiales bacterium]
MSEADKVPSQPDPGSVPSVPNAVAEAPPVTFMVLFYSATGAAVAWFTDAGKAFLREYWWAAAVAVLVFLLLVNVLKFKQWYIGTTAQMRIGLIVFAVLPALALLVACIVLLPAAYRVAAMRGVFLAVVCLLPATMYYLFIVTRKDSLLNEFIANLDRLGLLQPDRLALHAEKGQGSYEKQALGPRLRVETFVQRFEAVYGPLANRDEFVAVLLRTFDPGSSGDERRWPRRAVGFTEVFSVETAVPVIIATALIALGWLMVLPPTLTTRVDIDEALRSSLDPIAGPVGFAFLGAYFFTLQALFRRYVRRDLRASAYVAVCMRIVLAVIGTWVVVQVAQWAPNAIAGAPAVPAETLNVLGFVLGVFPPVVWQIVQTALRKVTFAEVALPSLSSQLPLSDLDGLTVWHESRFEEEDIENIANMATADLADLMLNTRIARGRIIDWVDQALLYTQLGPEPKNGQVQSPRLALRAHGIRTATALLAAYDDSSRRGDLAVFEQILQNAEDKGRSRLRSVVDAIVTAPNLELILTWKGISRNA